MNGDLINFMDEFTDPMRSSVPPCGGRAGGTRGTSAALAKGGGIVVTIRASSHISSSDADSDEDT